MHRAPPFLHSIKPSHRHLCSIHKAGSTGSLLFISGPRNEALVSEGKPAWPCARPASHPGWCLAWFRPLFGLGGCDVWQMSSLCPCPHVRAFPCLSLLLHGPCGSAWDLVGASKMACHGQLRPICLPLFSSTAEKSKYGFLVGNFFFFF